MRSRLALLAVLLGAVVLVGAGSGVGALDADHPVRAGSRLPCRDDAGRLLEHGGPVRDRPGRPGRQLRFGELRQQVPGRGGRVHGHRPRRHLRRRGGDRGRLSAVRDRAQRAGCLPRGGDRDRDARHARRPARARPEPRPAGDSRRRLRRVHERDRGRPGEGERHRSRSESGRSRARPARKRRPGEEPDRRRPRPARARPGRVATRARGGAGPSPARSEAARAHERHRSSGPTARTR